MITRIFQSTKERVPCIITLEVIDYGEPSSTTQLVNNESVITSDWVRQPRPPHRHSTLIDKVANYTQEGIGRLQDTINHLSHHGDSRPGVIDRRLSDFLGRDSWKRSAHANDEDEETARELGEIRSYSPSTVKGEEEEDDDVIMQLPPPPLGGPVLSEEEEDVALNDARAVPEPISPEKSNTFANNDIEKSPMGQWSTPKKKKLNLRKRNSFQNIAEEEEEIGDEDNSPQGKQRRRVMFPPTSTSMARSESFGYEPRMKATVEPKDTELLRTTAPTVVFKEDWKTKTERIRQSSIYGSNPNWRLLESWLFCCVNSCVQYEVL